MATAQFADTVLLIALPASGKSEVRRYMMHVDRAKRIQDFHLADTVQLDDYPYVEFMRETDDALAELGQKRVFFESAEGCFLHGEIWGVLLTLVSEDYAVITNPKAPTPSADPNAFFDRFDAASKKVGIRAPFATLDASARKQLADKMAKKAAWVVDYLFASRPESLDGKTVVIEFARGGKDGASMPLTGTQGYQYSLAQLSPEILEKAAVLYIWVDPEESRRKNRARAIPHEDTVLFHGTPEDVMLNDYGCDDIAYLIETSKVPNTITIHSRGKDYHLPIGRFDNRVDKTSFVRDDPKTWEADKVKALHEGLAEGLRKMWSAYKEVHKI